MMEISIFYASEKEDEKKLRKECDYLIKYGFPAKFLEHNILHKKYLVDKPCAIRTWQDADVNPYSFIQRQFTAKTFTILLI